MISEEFFDDELERIRKIDSICDRFEQDWLSDRRPSIESYLLEVHGVLKQALLVELIAIELHYRRKAGEAIEFAEYHSRFPGLSQEKLENSVEKSVQQRPKVNINDRTCDQPTIEISGREATESQSNFRNTTIGDYRILEPIAQGGMGVVYKARQISLNRVVALKMILSGELATKQEIERFYVEARAAAMLDHPGIVPIIEVGEFDGRHFFSMAYVEGISLASRLTDGPMVPTQAAALIQTITEAIQYAHDQGIIHRDLKPSNILLDHQGNPRVTDFGLAKKVSEDCGLTVSGQILGTPSFMPPEQAAGQIDTIGPASDVYALGAILYSLTTGRPPFQAASSVDTLRQVVEKEPVAPRQLNPSIPLDLETIILKCLEKSLPRRYSTARALGEELNRFVNGIPIQARPVGRIEKLWRWCKRQPEVASLSAVAVLLLSGLAVGASWAYFRESSFRHDLQVAFDGEKEAKDDALEAGQKADEAAKLAELARQEKERQAEIASRERDNAKTSEAAMRRNLYLSDVGRAQQAIQSSNYARAETLLERHRPNTNDQVDLRSVDWHLLQNQIERPKTSWRFNKPVEVICVSPDQTHVAVGCEGGRAYVVNLATGKVNENLPFFLDEEHWATLGFRHDGILVAHGRLGSIKFWDVSRGQTVAHKPRDYSPQYNNYRIPAAISSDGTRMIGADNTRLLALWNLDSLRPQQIPRVNEGFHVLAVYSQPMSFSANLSGKIPAYMQNPQFIVDAGFKDHGEYSMAQFAQSMLHGYSPVGVANYVPTMDVLHEPGHPVFSMASHHGKVVLGKTNGEIEVAKQSDLEDYQAWGRLEPCNRKVSSRPITSVAYLHELNVIAATDSEKCFLLNADSLEPIFPISSSQTPFCKVCAIGQGQFALGRKDGVVEIWSALDECKVLEIQSGTSDISGITIFGDSTSLLVSNLDGSVEQFQLAPRKKELIPGRGFLNEYHLSPSTLFWHGTNKSIAIHQSIGSQLKRFRLGGWKNPQKSSVINSSALLVTMDYMSPAIYKEQPIAKRLLGVFSQQLRLIDLETLEVLKNVDITDRSKSGEYPISLFKRTGNKFEHVSAPVDTSILSTALGKTYRNLSILSADDFPDEKRFVLAIGDSYANLVPRRELRLLIRDLEADDILAEVSLEGTQIQKSTFQLTAIDNERVILDGVFFSEDPNQQHTLIYDIPKAHIQVIDSRPTEESIKSSVSDPTPQIFNFVDSHKKIIVQSPSEIRVLDAQTLMTTHRLKAPQAQRFEFAHLSNDGDLFAVIKTSPTNFFWSAWNDKSNEWSQAFTGTIQRSNSMVSNYQWCLDTDRSILCHLASPFEIQRWLYRTGVALPSLHLPEVEVQKVVANGTGAIVAWSESNVPASLYSSQTPPWSKSWFQGDKATHELIQASLYDKSPPYFLPLTPDGDCWLTSEGLKTVIKGRNPSELIQMEGKKAPWNAFEFRNSQLLMSDDSQLLVEMSKDEVESWRRSSTTSDQLPLDFVSLGRAALPEQLTSRQSVGVRMPIGIPGMMNLNQAKPTERLSCLSRHGKLLAVLADNEIQYSILPFTKWASIDVSVIAVKDITALTCSADEQSLLVGLKDGDVVELRIEDHSPVRYPKGHLGPVTSLITIPDGKTFVSGGNDGNISVWDVRQKEVRLSMPAHRGAVSTLFWNQSTEEMLSGGEDGIVRRWPAASKSPSKSEFNSLFHSPNPSDPWTEPKATVDSRVQFNREMTAELQRRRIQFQTTNFGMRVRPSSDPSSFDQLSIDSIRITPTSDLNGFDLLKLQNLTELRDVKIEHPEVTSQDISKIAGLSLLYSLQVSGTDLADVQFERFQQWRNLRVLDLQKCSINDEQVKMIAQRFPELSDLNLASSVITDQSAEFIGKLARLQNLNLSNTALTDETASLINNLKRLEQLDLSGSAITGEGILRLDNLKLLKSVAIRGLKVLPEQFSRLWPERFPRTIDIRETLATKDSVRELYKKGVTSIFASSNVFQGIPEAEILAQLGPLPSMLEIDGTSKNISAAITSLEKGGSITSIVWPSDRNQTTESVDLLGSLTKLRSLSISNHAIPDIHFPLLQKLVQLTRLDISELPSTTNEQFALLYKIPNISTVRTKSLSKVTLKKLSGMPNLRSLEYSDGEDVSVVAIALPSLKQIDCKDQFDAAKLDKVAKQLTQLESLTTSAKPSNALLRALAKLPSLRTLKFQRKLSKMEIDEIKKALPNVNLQ